MMRNRLWRHRGAVLLHSALCLGALCITTTRTASAQSATVAEALFDDGRRLYDQGQYERACEKFAESQKLDPGTGTLLNLAICYEKAGRLATAWATWREAAASARAAGQTERETHARKMAAGLEPKLARVTVQVSDEARVEGLDIRQNGQQLHPAIWGTALPLDAGTYRIQASAPGYETWTTEIAVKDGKSTTLVIPLLQKGAEPAPVVAPTEEEKPAEEAEKSTDEPPAEEKKSVVLAPSDDPMKDQGGGMSPMRKTGFIVGGAGLVAAGVGAYFGISALSKYNQSLDQCRPEDPTQCTQQGANDRAKALTNATASTVLIGVGAAAAATGLVLIIVAPSGSTQVAAAPTPGGGHFLLQGTF